MKRIDELRQARDKVFQTPPIEWIEEMLSQFRESLEVNTNDSALVLRNLLGPINLEVNYPILESLITSPIIKCACNYRTIAQLQKYGQWFDFIPMVATDGKNSNLC